MEPGFKSNETVPGLCSELDGLPLALELAAARTVVFSPAQLLERLSQRLDLLKGGRKVDPRQQTLRTTIEWSFELWTPHEQRPRRLSVFVDGCSYDAAVAVCEADLETLQALLDKSLMRRRDGESESRYWMLETIREYAAGRLEESGEASVLHLRHAEWCCDLAERLVGVPGCSPTDERFGEFHDDHGNVRSALDWAWRSGEDEYGLRLGSAAYRFWMRQGFLNDAVSWLEVAAPKIALGFETDPVAGTQDCGPDRVLHVQRHGKRR